MPPGSPGPAQDPPNGLFWAQKWSKTVSPKNDPACFGRVYGAYSDRLGPISGLFWLGFRPPLAPKRRLVRSNSAGQQARTHAGEGCRLADNNNNNYYTPLPIIRTSKQATSNTSRHGFRKKNSSSEQGNRRGYASLRPHMPSSKPECQGKTPRQAPAAVQPRGGGGPRNGQKRPKKGQKRPKRP